MTINLYYMFFQKGPKKEMLNDKGSWGLKKNVFFMTRGEGGASDTLKCACYS